MNVNQHARPRVGDLMVRTVEVAHVHETPAAAADRMAVTGIGALPVVDGDELLGMISAHRRPAAPDRAPALHQAAVAGERRDPDQGGDGAAVELAEFGQQTQEGGQGDLADAGHGRQQGGPLAPHRAGPRGGPRSGLRARRWPSAASRAGPRSRPGPRAPQHAWRDCARPRPAARAVAFAPPAPPAPGRPPSVAGAPPAAAARRTAPAHRHRAGRSWRAGPAARAKSRTWRGLTTATAIPACASISVSAHSKPPVASTTT